MTRKMISRARQIVENGVLSRITGPSDLDIVPGNLRGPNSSYQRYIVLAHARSGSSMVVHTLNKHPNAICFGELFVEHRVGFNVEGYKNESRKVRYLRNRYPIQFLEKSIFSPLREDISAVGFKVFPDQLDSSRFRVVWQWLCNNQDVKVIILRRHNLLAAYTSLLIARLTGFGDPSGVTVTVDLEECILEFEKRQAYVEGVVRELRDHDVMNVSYEGMVEDLDKQFRSFQQFLGIQEIPVQIDSKKKETRPLSEVITNYHDLRRRLTDAGWGYLFEDESS